MNKFLSDYESKGWFDPTEAMSKYYRYKNDLDQIKNQVPGQVGSSQQPTPGFLDT